MNSVGRIVATAAVVLACVSIVRADVVIETVTVGNPGNQNDTYGDGYGAVDYTYDIGMYEVTAGQYTEFLNAVAATDTYGLYNENMSDLSSLPGGFGCNIQRTGSAGSYGYSVAADWADRPVNYISWGDATRFSNWLHNGQPTGAQELSTTENGSYFLNGAMTDADLLSIIRESDATWVIATEDEWYKAAYYDPLMGEAGAYHRYPTASDEVPSNALIDPDPGNNANFLGSDFTIGEPYWRTEVGEFENSPSPYGTFDQGGNVWEWSEAVIGSFRGMRGGSFGNSVANLDAHFRIGVYPTGGNLVGLTGFRVAEVPEPGTVVLLAIGGLLFMHRRE